MPDRKPRKIEQQNPINALRRSPRFLPENQIAAENWGTPKLTAKLFTASDSPGSCVAEVRKNAKGISQNGGRKDNCRRKSARLDSRANLSCPDVQKQYVAEKRVTRTSVRGHRFVYSQDNECGEVSGKGERGIAELKCSDKSGKSSRRCARLVDRTNGGKSEEVLFPQKQYVTEGRVTRGSVRRNKVVIIEICDSDSKEDSGKRARILSKRHRRKAGVDSCKKNIGNIEMRVTRSSSQIKMSRSVEKTSNMSSYSEQETVTPHEIKRGGDDELSNLHTMKNYVKDCDVAMINGDRKCKRKAEVGEKRNIYQVEEDCDVVHGWTREQELALQRAYFTAKPTPQFWKKVARMVPGKTAKECFDRINLDHSTPSQPPMRSRPKKKEPSPILFSASKLLSPSEKSKKLKSRRKTLVPQKTVRQLLQNQHNEDRDYEADLFSVLERTMDSPPLKFKETTPFSSPVPNKGSSVVTACGQMSLFAQGKQRSRLNSSHKTGLVSPPVLKQIKNKALHEKYIDQLHCRDAKRQAAALRKDKNVKDKIDANVSLLTPNLVKAAKDALVSDAQDAIIKLRSLESVKNDSIDDDDDNDCLSDVNEGQDDELY